MTKVPAARQVARKIKTAQRSWRQYNSFKQQFDKFSELCRALDVAQPVWSDRYPILNEATPDTGFDAHYIYHPAWAARLITRSMPAEHVNISSSLTFCSQLSAWVPTRFYGFRPAPLYLSTLVCERADVTALEFEDKKILSLSCMHVVEHIGLGRYGDPLDAQGDQKAMKELARVLAPGGHLYFVVPVGQPQIRFNAHRVYSFEQIRQGFPDLRLRSFALLPDDFRDGLIEGASAEEVAHQRYGCGCFCFTRES